MTYVMFARMKTSLDEAFRTEADLQAILFTTEDFEKGRKAFFEKRAPDFKIG